MESRGLIELRHPDGSFVVGDYEQFTTRTLSRGDHLSFDGSDWAFRDREDRKGVTVYLFTPMEEAERLVHEKQRTQKRAGMFRR
jgi:hypothetical protein